MRKLLASDASTKAAAPETHLASYKRGGDGKAQRQSELSVGIARGSTHPFHLARNPGPTAVGTVVAENRRMAAEEPDKNDKRHPPDEPPGNVEWALER